MAYNYVLHFFILISSYFLLLSASSELFGSHVNLMEEPSSIRLAPALYVFGDSVVDSGNNNHLPTQAKSNFLPYGVDFNGKPTGRFTNGRTIADYFG